MIGTSFGSAGTAMAQQHLRNVLVAVGLATMARPEAFVQFKEGMIEADGRLASEGTQKFLQGFLDAFFDWIQLQQPR